MFWQPRPGFWILMELQHPDPRRRRRAIDVVGMVAHPRLYPQARRVLEEVSHKEPIPELRALAKYYISTIDPYMARIAIPVGDRWDCAFCGNKQVSGISCPHCAAPAP